MTLIELKDDVITYILPKYEEKYRYADDFSSSMHYIGSIFSVDVDFERSTSFHYECESCYVDECAVSDTIKFLLSRAFSFKDLTAEEFKAQLAYHLDHSTK